MAIKTDWRRKFKDAIPLPSGRKLCTLWDAAGYITALPKAEQKLRHWRLAVKTLIHCAEGREFLMQAQIAMLRALNASKANPHVAPRDEKAKAYRTLR